MLRYEAVVIGASSGGWDALTEIFLELPRDFPLPIVVVQHLHPLQSISSFEFLEKCCALPVREVAEKEPVQGGHVYFAPANYHLLIEQDRTFSLSVDDRVQFARPSIDVLFESAAEVYGARLIGVILSGANRDGADGLRRIKALRGFAIAQDPATARNDYMPRAAIAAAGADKILPPREIGLFLAALGDQRG